MSPRRLLVPALLAAAVLGVPASAHAAGSCDAPASQVFARWLDPLSYQAVPGGSFESAAPAWTLAGGATTVAGNEPWRVGGSSDNRALSLPAGSSATSPRICAGLGHPTVRMFVKRTGGLLPILRADVVYLDGNQIIDSLPLGLSTITSSWAPSLPMLTLSGLPVLTGTDIAVRLSVIGGSVQVDDVYIDPFTRS